MPATKTTSMTQAEFVERAARRYAERADLNPVQARHAAEALWDEGRALADLDIDTPEDLADEDMSNWDNDE